MSFLECFTYNINYSKIVNLKLNRHIANYIYRLCDLQNKTVLRPVLKVLILSVDLRLNGKSFQILPAIILNDDLWTCDSLDILTGR